MGNFVDTINPSSQQGNLFAKGSTKYDLTQSNLNILESNLLEFSGLPSQDIKQVNVEINFIYVNKKLPPVYIRTLIVGDKKKPILVLVHGYGSSAPMFYKLFKGLSQHFCIICPDMIGMGGSSRPDNYKASMSPEDSIDYMVIHFEAWRRSLELKKFYLVAHSMGAYFSCNYALKYPQYVRRLILLSPIGIRVPLPDESWNRGTNTRVRNGAGPPDFNILTGASYKMLKLTPGNIGRFCGHALSKQYILHQIEEDITGITDEEKNAMCDYIYQIFLRKGTTEYALHVNFDQLFHAYVPLGTKDKLGSDTFPIPISIMVGDQDWTLNVEDDAAIKIVNHNKKLHGEKSNYYIVKNSGHSMQFDNPEQVVKNIIEEIMGPEDTLSSENDSPKLKQQKI